MSTKRFEWEVWVTALLALVVAGVIIGTYFLDKENIAQEEAAPEEPAAPIVVTEAASAANEPASKPDFGLLLSAAPDKDPENPFTAEKTDAYKSRDWYPCVAGLMKQWSRVHCYGECRKTVLRTEISELLSERTKYGIEYTLHVAVGVSKDAMGGADSYQDNFLCHLGRQGQILSVNKVEL